MSAIEKVAILLQQLPQLHRMAEEAEAERKAQALQARREAIATYRHAAKEQEAARERLTKAEAKLEALRAKLDAERQLVTVAYQEAVAASNRFSAASHALHVLHGEAALENARHRLHFMAEEARRLIAGLQANLIETIGGGVFRRERPEVRAKLTAAQEKLQRIEAAQAEIGSLLLTEELTPDQLAQRVQAIMNRVAPPAQKPSTQAED